MANTKNPLLAQNDPEQPILSRSNSAASVVEQRIRPKSRGSTASLQSVGVGNAFQPPPQHQHQQREQNISLEHAAAYMQQAPSAMYAPRPEESMMHYQQQMVPIHHPQQIMDHTAVVMAQHDMRPMSRQSFHDITPYPMQYPSGMPQYAVSQQHMQHMRHQSYEGSPAPEDSQNENGGAKRRKGAASSMANDQELRRLLVQYQGKSLQEVAAEVQKNEGSGGKSEKAKQVFAMLWLQESCRRSTNSVRRDRVFARYTERCGNERVPTLNPASFGKLVRIIFPNVQTRRLGVRGESKYHYVDLSLVPDDEDRQPGIFERPGTSGSIAPQRPESSATDKPFMSHIRADSIGHIQRRTSMDTAEFPLPSPTFFVQSPAKKNERPKIPEVHKLDCRLLNTPTIRISTINMQTNLINALPAVRNNLPATMATYLSMPTENSLSGSSTQDTPIELPDIHEYLAGTNYDHHLAKLLHDLYRSYCIDVIDAFRKCKEKSFFNHHSAFNGKMTVPVSKLFSLDCIAPWIQECDMRMYKQIVKFLAALAQQNVPDTVWAMFDRVGARLVSHLVAAFEEKCPVHVVVAKVVPAARFTTVLKKLKGANAAALQLSRILEDPQQRTQMWLDLMAMVDPDGVIDESNPPPENLEGVRGILRNDFRVLISPLDEPLVHAAENDPTSPYAELISEPANFTTGVLPVADQPVGLLERWIQWLERLPVGFEGHHPQCMMDWHSRFWRSIMSQIGIGGARSYQSCWYLENFATRMLAFMTNMEGFLLSGEEQKRLDGKEMEKKQQRDEDKVKTENLKRKRDAKDIGGDERSQTRPDVATAAETTGTPPPLPSNEDAFQSPILEHVRDTTGDIMAEDDDPEMVELRRGGPLDLPTFRTGLSSPIKQENRGRRDSHGQIDDSGIDLGLDIASGDADMIEAEREARKFNKRDWLLSSDPVEAPMSSMGVVI